MLSILNSVMEHAIHSDERIFDLNSIDFTEEPLAPINSLPRNQLVMVATNSLNLDEVSFVQGTLATITIDEITIIEGLTTKGEKVRNKTYRYTFTEGLVIPLANVTFNSKPIMEIEILEDSSLNVNINLIRYTTVHFTVNDYRYSLKMDKDTRSVHVSKWDTEGSKLYVEVHKGIDLAISYEKFVNYTETVEPIFKLSYEGEKVDEQPT